MRLLVVVFLFIISQELFAQKMPISFVNKQLDYCLADTLFFVISNESDESFNVMIGLEKYIGHNIWEEVTENILLSEDEILGKSKGGLLYYLTIDKAIHLKRKIEEINLPQLLTLKSSENELDGKYRLSASDEIAFNLVMTGKFRLSIRCTDELYQSEFVVVKSSTFFINQCND